MTGVLAIWSSVESRHIGDMRSWHDGEHLDERVRIPGFRRARRFRSLKEPGRFLSLYELDDVSVLDGDAYQQVLAAPTEWTRHVLARQTGHVTRIEGQVCSFERGCGGLLASWHFDVAPESHPRRCDLIAAVLSGSLANAPEFAAFHIILARRQADGARGAPPAGPLPDLPDRRQIVVLAEGSTSPDAFDRACASLWSQFPFCDMPQPETYVMEALRLPEQSAPC